VGSYGREEIAAVKGVAHGLKNQVLIRDLADGFDFLARQSKR